MPRMSEETTNELTEPDSDQGVSAAAVAAALRAEELPGTIEALLLTTDRALSEAKMKEVLGKVHARQIAAAITQLNQAYADTGRSFRIEQVAGGWQILTLPKYAPMLALLHRSRAQMKLSPAALETLAIISYKQPTLRAEVEAIRGVSCGEVLRSLMERRLVKIVGRAEEIGRPMLYGTTKLFLEAFGLASLKDLPKVEDLKKQTA